MATIEEVQAALEDAREQIEELNKELTERDVQIGEIENAAAQKESSLEQQWRNKLEAVNADWEAKAAQVAVQRDQLLAAVEGDSSGWEEKVDQDGNAYYENANTGETDYDKPMLLAIADMIKGANEAADQKAALAKANRKAKDAEAKFRKVDVLYSTCKEENNNLKAVVTTWNEASAALHENMTTFDRLMAEQMRRVSEKVAKHHGRSDSLAKKTAGVVKSSGRVAVLRNKIKEWEGKYQHLDRQHTALEADHRRAAARIEELERSMQDEVDRRVAPIEEELAQAYAELQRGRAKHEQDLSDAAALWPAGFLLPSILAGHRDVPPQEKEKKAAAAAARDAALAITQEIRRKAARAAEWQPLQDQYGQQYFLNRRTQETVWEVPEEMLYQPPEGYDMDGQRVRKQMSEGTRRRREKEAGGAGSASQEEESPWAQEADPQGRPYWVHKTTGESTYDPPPGHQGSAATLGAQPSSLLSLGAGGGGGGPGAEGGGGAAVDLENVAAAQMPLLARKVIAHLREAQRLAQRTGEEFIVDWQALEELAAGQEGWEYDMDGDEDEDEDELEAVEPTEAELREKIYQHSVTEQKCELKLARLRKKLVEWSHELVRVRRDELDRLLGIQKAGEDDAVAEARRKAAEAMKDTEDMIAKAMDAFKKGDDVSVAEEEEEASLRSKSHVTEVSHLTQKQEATVAEIAEREAFPLAAGVAEGTQRLAALGVWAGYLGRGAALGPDGSGAACGPSALHVPREELGWKAAAFMGELEEELGTKLSEEEVKSRMLGIGDVLKETKELPLLQSTLGAALARLQAGREAEGDGAFLRRARRAAEEEAAREEALAGAQVELPGTIFERQASVPAYEEEEEFWVDQGANAVFQTPSEAKVAVSRSEATAESLDDNRAAGQSESRETKIRFEDSNPMTEGNDDNKPIAEGKTSTDQEEDVGAAAAEPKEGSSRLPVGEPSTWTLEERALAAGAEAVAPSRPLVRPPRPARPAWLVPPPPEEAIAVAPERPGSWRRPGTREKTRRQQIRVLLLEAAGKNAEEAEEAAAAFDSDDEEDIEAPSPEELARAREARNRLMWDQALALVRREAGRHALALRALRDEAAAVAESNWQRHDAAEFDLQKKLEELEGQYKEAETKHAGIEKEIESLVGITEELKKPLPEPEKPEEPTIPTFVPTSIPEAVEVKKGDEAEVRAIVNAINAGSYDNAGAVPLPEGLTLDDAQRQALEGAAAARDRLRQAEIQRLQNDYAADRQKYEEEMEKWRAETRRRKDELFVQDKQLKTAQEQGSVAEKGKDMAKLLFDWADLEVEAERERAKCMWEAANRAEVAQSKQVLEATASRRAIERLQLRLEIAVEERERARRMGRGAVDEQDRGRLLALRGRELRRCREACADVRQGLVAEGRRRRRLCAEELAVARQELRRVRQEEAQANERADLLALVDALLGAEAKARGAYLAFREDEIRNAVDVVDGGRGLDPSKEANALLRAWQQEGAKLEAAVGARSSACRRQGELYAVLYANGPLDAVPAEAYWVPRAQRRRHLEDLRAMEENQRDALFRARTYVEEADQRARVYDLVHARLAEQAAETEAAHRAETEALKASFARGVAVLKPLIEKCRRELQAKVDALEAALTDLSQQFNDYTARSVAALDKHQREAGLRDAWLETLRHETGREVVLREVLQDDYNKLMGRYKKETAALKDELWRERAHSNRVRLWIAGMHADVKHYLYEIRRREEQQRQTEMADEIEKRRLRFQNWQNLASIYILFTDVDSLFLFFAQRLANLAGARRMYNERLRENGALDVLLSLSKGPRQEIRALASRALAGFGWNGFVEHRIVGWNCKRHWQEWVKRVIPTREHQMRALRVRFEEERRRRKGKKVRRSSVAELMRKEFGSQGTLLDGESIASNDASAHTEFAEDDEEFEPSPDMSLRDIIRARRQWALRRARRKESPNMENQMILGTNKESIEHIIKLMENKDWEIVRNAVLSLSIAAYDDSNSEALGAMQGCVGRVVACLGHADGEVRCHAAAALANLSYGSAHNQAVAGDAGAVEALVGLLSGPDLDAVEAASAALANLLAFSDRNAHRLQQAGGLEVLAGCLTTSRLASLLDADLLAEVHANAAEALANGTRALGREAADRLHRLGAAPLVLLCGARNPQVARHAALVLGNVAQEEAHRAALGARGAVEALCLLAGRADADALAAANGLWALANLAWHPDNQERLARYLGELVGLCEHAKLPVRANALAVVANAVYYHEGNRRRYEALDPGLAKLLAWCGQGQPGAVQESALRALVSLTYTERVALPLGAAGAAVPLLLGKVDAPASVDVQRFALMALANLAVHDANKRRVLEAGGVEVLVRCQGHDAEKVRDLARRILDALADIREADELGEKRRQLGIAGFFQLLQNDSPQVQKLAAESIAEEVWLQPKKQKEVAACGGIEVLLALLKNVASLQDQVVLPVLWSLRNAIHGSVPNRARASAADGVAALLALCQFYHASARQPRLLEASLTTFISLIIDSESNCRRVIRNGIDILIDIAEGYEAAASAAEQAAARGGDDEAAGEGGRALAKSNAALAASALQIVGPYNYFFCGNCGAKQTQGTTCAQCGRGLDLDEETLAAQYT